MKPCSYFPPQMLIANWNGNWIRQHRIRGVGNFILNQQSLTPSQPQHFQQKNRMSRFPFTIAKYRKWKQLIGTYIVITSLSESCWYLNWFAFMQLFGGDFAIQIIVYPLFFNGQYFFRWREMLKWIPEKHHMKFVWLTQCIASGGWVHLDRLARTRNTQREYDISMVLTDLLASVRICRLRVLVLLISLPVHFSPVIHPYTWIL